MKDKLAVIVLGERNSGKSLTWNRLFGSTQKTGTRTRDFDLSDNEYVELFLISGSPQERGKTIDQIIGRKSPRLLLCSLQYVDGVKDSIDRLLKRGYSLHVQWLNPGYSADGSVPDHLGLLPYLLYRNATVAIRDGKKNPRSRVQEIFDLIFGWVQSRNLIYKT